MTSREQAQQKIRLSQTDERVSMMMMIMMMQRSGCSWRGRSWAAVTDESEVGCVMGVGEKRDGPRFQRRPRRHRGTSCLSRSSCTVMLDDSISVILTCECPGPMGETNGAGAAQGGGPLLSLIIQLFFFHNDPNIQYTHA